MHTKTIRPGLTAAMTAGRHLLAAGWRYDSTTPMADDTTIRTLLHPSGREIHARTDDRDGDTTALTMTGLSLEQVAGAITGAGLAEPTATVDLSYAGVDHLLAALADAGLTAYDNDTDGHTYVEVWLTDLSLDHGPTILSWREPSGWRVQTFAKPEDYGDNKPARSWSSATGSLAEVARDVATILGTTSARVDEQPAVEPDPRQRLAAELHRIADDIVTQQLPLGRITSASLGVGVLDSRADLERWAAYLGGAVQVDSNGIPYTEGQIPLGERYGSSLTVSAQTRQEHPSELERLRSRVAELEAKHTEDGAR